MKRAFPLLRLVFSVMLFLACSSHAYAVGIGLTTGAAYENWYNDSNYSGGRYVSNIGLLLDTRVRRNKLFGYRFAFLRERNKDANNKLNMYGFATTHDFTFGLVRTPKLRFWVGPRLKVSFNNKVAINSDEGIVQTYSWTGENTTIGDVWGYGVGPVIGLNVHLPDRMTFSFTVAYLALNYNGDTDYDTTSGKHYNDLAANSDGLYLNVAFIYRNNE